jgi:hypothetical protein
MHNIRVALWADDPQNPYCFKINPKDEDLQDSEPVVLVDLETVERWKRVQDEWNKMQDEMDKLYTEIVKVEESITDDEVETCMNVGMNKQ